MTTPRTYGDPCAVAHALDVVGERWALIVVRELLFGPKRFTDLRAGLGPASPNVVSQRLRELEEAGVVRRRRLGPPANVWVYELTDWGHDLEPILSALGSWGRRSPARVASPPTGETSPDARMLALKGHFEEAGYTKLETVLELRLDGDRFGLRIAGGRMAIEREPVPGGVAAVIEMDAATLAGLRAGQRDIDAAIDAGDVQVTGDMGPVRRLFTAVSASSATAR